MSSRDYFSSKGPKYVWSHPMESVKAALGMEQEASAVALDKVEGVVSQASEAIGGIVGAGIKGGLTPMFGDWWWIALMAILGIILYAIIF